MGMIQVRSIPKDPFSQAAKPTRRSLLGGFIQIYFEKMKKKKHDYQTPTSIEYLLGLQTRLGANNLGI